MRRGSKFMIGFATAALTFGSLWAFVGPKQREQAPWHRAWEERGHHHGGCHDYGDSEGAEKAPEKSPKESPTL